MRIYYLNGKKYITHSSMHNNGTARLKLMPFDEKRYNKLISEIVANIKHAMNSDDVLKAALEQMSYKTLLSIRRTVRDKKNVNVRGKKGCYEIFVESKKEGLHIIPIVDGL